MDDYAYLNARIRAMNGELFDDAFLQGLLVQVKLSQMTDSLLSSPYAEDLSIATTTAPGLEATEKALRNNLCRTLRKVQNMCSDEPHRLVRVLLSRWDTFNIKTALRGKQTQRPMEEVVSAFIPIGELDESRLVELLNQYSIEAVIDTLATWGSPFTSPLRQALLEYLRKGRLTTLEEALDSHYFRWALLETQWGSEDEHSVRDITQDQIDYSNMVIALKILNKQVKHGEVNFISGGHMSHDFLDLLSSLKSLDEVVTELEKTRLVQAFGDSLHCEPQKSADIEHYLSVILMRKWRDQLRKDPLSISVILGFLGRKLREFLNLRMIARGKEHNVPAEIIRKELLIA